MNERLTIQQGLFLCPGDITKTFQENLEVMSDHKKNVLVIPIRSDSRSELLAALFRANLSRASLFPDLDGFSFSLWTRVASLVRLQRMEEDEKAAN